ncbi:MAG: 3-oxoacid CoA-transferase, partial [Leptospiraceae bacterium]|nr:3-oxoacid CoA-transferase [Leptospiraceae bacterium]
MVRKLTSPGMHIHLSATMARPNALIYSLARVYYEKNPELIISLAGLHSSAHAITLSKIAKKVITGFAGDNYPKPGPNPLYKNVLNGDPFEFELWSLLTMVQRLMASALKLPGFITRSLVGSDLATDKIGKTLFLLPDPLKNQAGSFDAKKHEILRAERGSSHIDSLAYILPMTPDVSFVHGILGDENGNLVLCPPAGEGPWGALAASKGIIASVEKIVPAGELPKELVSIPGYKVLGLCEVPFGAHPQSLRVHSLEEVAKFGVKTYLDDYEFQIEANKASAIPNLAKRWMDDFVLIENHDAYLKKVGKSTLRKLYNFPEEDIKGVKHNPSTVNDTEQMIILAARAIIEHVERKGYKTILAGIGAAHIAAWTAQILLEKKGISVNVVTELGFYNMKPHVGDVFLFSQLHANKSTQLSDIPSILGTVVPDQCLGVIGAGELDWFGNVNSTKTEKGRFIVGSGGANDIAATADCIVVAKANRIRYLREVNFITSVGNRVMEAICQFGRFRRVPNSDQIFEFTNWIAPPSEDEIEPFEAVLKYTSWLPPDE